MEKPFSYYLRENIYATTSGVFDLPVFERARAVPGIDNRANLYAAPPIRPAVPLADSGRQYKKSTGKYDLELANGGKVGLHSGNVSY